MVYYHISLKRIKRIETFCTELYRTDFLTRKSFWNHRYPLLLSKALTIQPDGEDAHRGFGPVVLVNRDFPDIVDHLHPLNHLAEHRMPAGQPGCIHQINEELRAVAVWP